MSKRRKRGATPVDEPNLLERTFAEGCTRIAVISLHPSAGARTVVESIASEFHRRGVPTGVTRAPRIVLDAQELGEQVSRINLPVGTLVATTADLARDCSGLEPLESTDCSTALGDLYIFRVGVVGEVPVYGPDDPDTMSTVLGRLEKLSGGVAIMDGAWERRRFAAPDVAQGVVLVVGSGYSGSPERSAAALRYIVETLDVARCSDAARRAWSEAARRNAPVVLDSEGRLFALSCSDAVDPTLYVEAVEDGVETLILPDLLRDEFLAPLTRSAGRFNLVVKDPTRIRVAPVYFKGWLKGAGSVQVLEPIRVLAVATNPINPLGADADPDEFRRLVVEALPGLPVHDVRLEADEGKQRSSVWKFWT